MSDERHSEPVDDDRMEFLLAVETARAECDPCADWPGFREALWAHLAPAMGMQVGEWPDELPRPDAGADAHEVAAWLRRQVS